jgi:3-oxoacyl-[acyl-carrier protein] reductase
MILELKNRRALVCGSTRGIGKAVAMQLAAQGASVTLVARNEQSLREVKGELPASGSQLHSYLSADFGDPPALRRLVDQFIARSGPVHILVNNTGGPPSGPITRADPAEFITAFNAHLVCNHLLAQACIEGMKHSGYGRIINIISTSVKQPLPNLGVSNTIRAAVASWAKTLANEAGRHGITVNNVLPGATATQRLSAIIEARSARTGESAGEIREDMLREIPLGRFADPSEVANAVAFLASPAAGYINGINLPVDGGRTSSL